MSTNDRASYYYSGQGVVMIGERTAAGKPAGLIPVGNVSALAIAIETDVLEHKESQSGQRAIDLRLTQEIRANLTITVENFIRENLELALRASSTVKAAGSVTAEVIALRIGAVEPLDNVKVSSVVIDGPGSTAMTLYTDDATPWDYKLNGDAGSITFNDGSVLKIDKMADDGEAITSGTPGGTTVLGMADTTGFVVGGKCAIDNSIVGDAGDVLEGRVFTVTAIVANTTITIDADTTGLTYTSGGKVIPDGAACDADYDYAAQNRIDALTEAAQERYLRFEGLNTADGFNPVVVEIFKFLVDPLAELALIGDEIGQFEMAGSALADPLQPTGSQFFKATLLR